MKRKKINEIQGVLVSAGRTDLAEEMITAGKNDMLQKKELNAIGKSLAKKFNLKFAVSGFGAYSLKKKDFKNRIGDITIGFVTDGYVEVIKITKTGPKIMYANTFNTSKNMEKNLPYLIKKYIK